MFEILYTTDRPTVDIKTLVDIKLGREIKMKKRASEWGKRKLVNITLPGISHFSKRFLLSSPLQQVS
jgi:hypothetical protein